MAGVERRNPNLDDFIGLNWSCWTDRVNVVSSDVFLTVDGFNTEDTKHGANHSQTMTLSKEDMHIYGHCPANDDFYLVVCSHCDQVVKPQAFETHCEKWHRPVIKTPGQASAQAPQQLPSPGRSSSRALLCNARQKDGRCRKNGGQSTAVVSPHPNKSPKILKEAMSVSSRKALTEKSPLHPPSSFSTPRHGPPPPRPPAQQPPSDCASSSPLSERPSIQKLTVGQPTEPHCPQRGMRTYNRTHKSIHKNECEPNKQKSLYPQKKKVCSPELISNTESCPQLQKSSARLTSPDQQPVQLTTAGEGQDPGSLPLKSEHTEKRVDAVEEKKATMSNARKCNSNCQSRRLKNPSENVPPEEGNPSADADVQLQCPFNQNLLSSDNSDEEEQEEAADLPATPWHPKPLGLCTFGCRTMGCSIFTFDRRLHRLRFALTAMLEHHANAHIWKKMPKVSPSLRSQRASHPLISSNTGLKPTGSPCLDSSSVGPLETKSSQHDSQSTKSPHATISASSGTFKPRDHIGRPGKAQLTQVKDIKDAAPRHPQLLLGSKNQSTSRGPSPHDPNQRRVLSPDEDASNTEKSGPPHPSLAKEREQSDLGKLSPFPLPSLCSPRRREGIPGAVQKLLHNQSIAKKRKGSVESLQLCSSLSRSSKLKCLSLPSHSSLISWKDDVVQDVLTWGLDKRSDS